MSKSVIIFVSIIIAVTVGVLTGKIPGSWVVTGFTFLGVLGVLVYIHEAGHFITARRNKVTCHEFGFGFPPRIGGFVKDDKTGVRRFIWGSEEYYGNNTLFSINWIPLGGFVRIKGENADPHQEVPEADSFAAQTTWVKFKILIAGVVMNFLLGWVLISIGLMLGSPVPVGVDAAHDIPTQWIVGSPQVLINAVADQSAAQQMGIKTGDAIEQVCSGDVCTKIASTEGLINAVNENKGQLVQVIGQRGGEQIVYEGVLGSGSGALGVNMAEMVIVKYPPHIAVFEGLQRAVIILYAILGAFGALVFGLVTGAGVGADVAGPVGIAQLTGQMRELGAVYLLQFAAILSLNLAIFNALPIPALDGGRIFFILLEKIKGKAVNPKTEGLIHTISFTALILFMLYISTKEIVKMIG